MCNHKHHKILFANTYTGLHIDSILGLLLLIYNKCILYRNHSSQYVIYTNGTTVFSQVRIRTTLATTTLNYFNVWPANNFLYFNCLKQRQFFSVPMELSALPQKILLNFHRQQKPRELFSMSLFSGIPIPKCLEKF